MRDIFMIFAAVALGVVGQVSLKKGMLLSGSAGLNLSLIKVIFTPYIFLGLVLYGIAMFLWLSILSRVDLSYAYPMLSLSYVFIVLASWLIFNENLSFLRLMGVLCICLGVIMVGRS
ncbi:MAG: EamA family transporter [Thermodesulfobacteriota bacterium]|jgi:multidrug transporter EmrE-like cation transporter|nr:MAG: EamA family transporter [Thermodesulfobacteriota bacterium]